MVFAGIRGAAVGDIRDFPASFRSLPTLTIACAMLKLAAYFLFGVLFALMVYVPWRNLWLKRVVSRELKSVSTKVVKKKVMLSIQLAERIVNVPNLGGLESALNE